MRRLLRWAAAIAAGSVLALAGAAPARADQVRADQWWLGPLQIAEAHAVNRGDGVIVGMIDGPVEGSNPVFGGRVLRGKGATAIDAADGWGDGDAARHATAVAAILAGESPGGNSFLGVAPGAKILPFATDRPNEDTIAAGLRWLTDQGAKVINVSIAGDHVGTPEEISALRYAASHDVVVVAGAGNVNANGPNVGAPARIPGVVAVAGADKLGREWSGSSHGPEVVLAAPGVEMVVPAPAGVSPSGWSDTGGTSLAAPIVAGTAALIRAKFPQLNAANVVQRLVATAKDQSPPGRDPISGFGTVKPFLALTADVPEVKDSPLGPMGGASGPGGDSAASQTSGGSSSSSGWIPVALVAGGGAALLLVVLVIVLVSRRRPRPAAGGFPPPGWHGPPPGGPPQQYAPPQGQQQWTGPPGPPPPPGR